MEVGSDIRPTRAERRVYRAAENRLKESIAVRDALPSHTYPRHAEDLEVIRNYHSKYGIPDIGLWARAKRLMEW